MKIIKKPQEITEQNITTTNAGSKIVIPQVAIDMWRKRYMKKYETKEMPMFDEDEHWLKSIKGDDYENIKCKKRL